jgi:hypothetical protein
MFEIITLGSLVFWLIAIPTLVLLYLSTCEEEGEAFSAIISAIAVVALILFTNFNLPLIYFIPGYMFAGLVTWFVTFNFKLMHLKEYLREKNLCDKESVKTFFKNEIVPSRIEYIYKNEPSYGTFSSRTLAWPVVLVKLVTKDLMYNLYGMIRQSLYKYKDKFLGLS